MDGRTAASTSPLQAALRFHCGQPMIYSTIAKRMFIQINDSLVDPLFTEVENASIQDYLGCDDWEPWEDIPAALDSERLPLRMRC
jgi:hypothetical protein